MKQVIMVIGGILLALALISAVYGGVLEGAATDAAGKAELQMKSITLD